MYDDDIVTIIFNICSHEMTTSLHSLYCQFNETYTTLIPALLMGNTVVMKIPLIGGLAHVLTMDVYNSSLPPGAMSLIDNNNDIDMINNRCNLMIIIMRNICYQV